MHICQPKRHGIIVKLVHKLNYLELVEIVNLNVQGIQKGNKPNECLPETKRNI